MAVVQQEQYNAGHIDYDAIDLLPMGILSNSLVAHALFDRELSQVYSVLDLGGGSGLLAQTALDEGSCRVHIVDLSDGTRANDIRKETRRDDLDCVTWYHGDISTLDELRLDVEYGTVMANWTFDRAESLQDLERMWDTVSRYTRPGGRLISLRMCNPFELSDWTTYGATISNVEAIPGGAKFVYAAHTDPEYRCAMTDMEANWDFEQAKAMAERHGFQQFEVVPAEEMECVQEDPVFWRSHVERPEFICVTAVKEGKEELGPGFRPDFSQPAPHASSQRGRGRGS